MKPGLAGAFLRANSKDYAGEQSQLRAFDPHGISNLKEISCAQPLNLEYDDAFSPLNSDSKPAPSKFQRVQLPESLTVIGWGAFDDCQTVTPETFPPQF